MPRRMALRGQWPEIQEGWSCGPAPELWSTLMQLCWHADAATRPTFPQIRVSLVDAGRTEDAKLLWLRADLTEQSMDRVEKLLAESLSDDEASDEPADTPALPSRAVSWLAPRNALSRDGGAPNPRAQPRASSASAGDDSACRRSKVASASPAGSNGSSSSPAAVKRSRDDRSHDADSSPLPEVGSLPEGLVWNESVHKQ